MTIILGIDPGSRFTGYGVIKQQARSFEYLGSGCIKALSQGDSLGSRLQTIFAGVSEIIRQFNPDEFAIEQVFMAKNPDSALKLDKPVAQLLLRQPITVCLLQNIRQGK